MTMMGWSFSETLEHTKDSIKCSKDTTWIGTTYFKGKKIEFSAKSTICIGQSDIQISYVFIEIEIYSIS